MADDVEFSLNKQRRWELPDVLKDLIVNHEPLGDFGVQLIHRHRINRNANCVSVFATDGVFKNGQMDKERQFKIKNKGGFFQSNSVMKSKPTYTRRELRERRRRRENGEIEETNEETSVTERPQIRYEVHVPTPQTSFLAYNIKTVGMEVTRPTYFRNREHKRRHNLIRDIYDDMDIMNDSCSDQEEECINNDCVEDLREKDYTMILEDLIIHANRAASLLRQKRFSSTGSEDSLSSKCSESNKKGRIIVMEKDDMKKEAVHKGAHENTAPVKQAIVEALHVSVILKNEETVPKTLAQVCGSDYVESSCFPRKFVLNISRRVSSSPIFRKHSKFVHAFLVFTRDTDNEINNLKETVHKLHLNADFGRGMTSSRIETIFDYIEINIEDIIERTLFYIETLPVNYLNTEISQSDLNTFQKNSTLEECNKWLSQSYRPNNQTVLQWFIKETTNFEEAEKEGFDVVDYFDACLTDDSTEVSSVKDRFCSVCFESLCPERPGTALMSCCHWFCDSCWREHLSTQIELGAIDLECPEYDCERKVDVGTLISLVNLRDVIRNARKRHETHIEQKAVAKWCPKTICGRLIKVHGVDNKLAKCACGGRYCVDCLGSFHWPASCSDYQEYIRQMKKNGDISLLPPEAMTIVIANGKNCPNCHRFVEKNGGCPYMMCVCKEAFCWGCGKSWNGRIHGVDCQKYGHKDTHNTKHYKFFEKPIEERKRHGWYKMAVQHRINQHPTRKSRINRVMKVLTKSVQGELGRRILAGQRVVVEGQEVDLGNSFYVSQTLLRNTLDMYVEVNNIVENTSVLLNAGCIADKERLKLRCISRRLSAFAGVIYELFINYTERKAEAGTLLDRLLKVREHVRRCVQSVSATVKTL